MPRLKVWKDLDLEFASHPNTGDVVVKQDVNAIVRSVKQLLLTDFYERPFQPELGSNVRARLFDPMSYATTLRIKEDILTTLGNHEPRVDIHEINVEAREQQNGYIISLKFFILNEQVERTVTFFLERNR